MFLDRLRSVIRPEIRTRGELRGYVARVTVLCGVLAVAFDVVNQLTFFIDWETAVRSWVVSAFVGCGIAAPVAFAIARAHLDLYRAKQVVEELSRTDPLTGLFNRRALLEPLESSPPDFMALVIADIDRFKAVNDTHGHLVGDRVIKMVAEEMKGELGGLGRIGRIGGEEFALIATSSETEALIEKLWDFRDHIAATPIVADSASFRVTISIGVAMRKDGQTFDQLFADADRALYLAKASGRNRVVTAAELEDADTPEPPNRQPDAMQRRHFRSAS